MKLILNEICSIVKIIVSHKIYSSDNIIVVSYTLNFYYIFVEYFQIKNLIKNLKTLRFTVFFLILFFVKMTK